MIAVRGCRAYASAALAAGLIAATGAAPAGAETLSPWWAIESAQLPSSIHGGGARDEVQELAITSTPAIVELKLENQLVALLATEPYAATLAVPEATAANLQTALESPSAYGPGNVTVTGGPAGKAPFIITTAKGAGDQSVPAIEVKPFFGIGEVSNRIVSTGRADGELIVTAQNRGDGDAHGSSAPIVIEDTVPKSLEAVAARVSGVTGERFREFHRCSVAAGGASVRCEFTETIGPYQQLELQIQVVAHTIAGGENQASISGGGAATGATTSQSVDMGEGERFDVEHYQLTPEEPGGGLDTQAGSHPFQLTTAITVAQKLVTDVEASRAEGRALPMPVKLPQSVVVQWPPGMVGNPTPLPQCTDQQFAARGPEPALNQCPAETAVGVAAVTFDEPELAGVQTFLVPLFNLVPTTGEPARFGFEPAVPVFLDVGERTGRDYGLTIGSHNITQLVGFWSVRITVWGVPGDPRHDAQRGWDCLFKATTACSLGQAPTPPFLLMPTSCEQPFSTTAEAESWPAPGEPAASATPLSYTLPESMDGCNHLPFAPEISVAPDVSEGSTPSGLTVGVHVPQAAITAPKGLTESALRDTTVTLPQGVTVNPGGADGLEACSEAQVGFEGVEPSSGRDLFSPERGSCPDASKIGTLEIETPLLPRPLKGAAYVATQSSNPFGSLLAMYLIAEDPISGTLVKLPGEVSLNPVTGQLVSTFLHTPEIPFENLRLHFFGGDRAPLSTPAACGAYSSSASFAPWSGNPPVQTSSSFQITSGPSAGPCSSPLPFAPALTAGTTSIQAGGFTPFTMTMSRPDGDQSLDAITLHMPPGVSGMLSGIPLCAEAQANAGLCPSASQIGETTISVGLGGNPYTVSGGRVYITGPYRGAPFGLSIVNPAKAGPFDVGHGACDCVVVRAKIEIDPTTAAITVTSDTSGPYSIPTILDGIPLQIKHVNVTIDRAGFTFNPTNCEKMAITGDLTSSEGASDALSVPFQATNCAVLGFKPQFSVSAGGHPTRTDGTGLVVKLAYPRAPFGSQSNIAKVRVELPKQLPSRLTTLQKACPDSVFNANPADCPAASRVGEAIATTPIIPESFEGPAYFVSHGGAKFPELIIVLHGYALTVYLHGETFISKAGITSSTFNTVPDVPIGSFELKLPAGPDSALTGNGNLCAQKLYMPTTFTAQNGTTLKQKTTIAVSGCRPQIRVVRHRVKGKRATITIAVPSAGRLVADGGGVHRTIEVVHGAGTVTLTLQLSRAQQRFVARHHGRLLQVPITLSFAPSHGTRLQARVAVLMR
ncbi:MAG: hypothetical protein FWD42_03805 [Solirubrobacterales bacterium]|nr:hypothetical protein [Solirubrobacterales bacterium]